jgi:hypothetical protein
MIGTILERKHSLVLHILWERAFDTQNKDIINKDHLKHETFFFVV